MELRSTRLTLRRPVAEDVPAILAVHADPLACAHNPSDALGSLADAERLFAHWDDHWQRTGFGYWVVRRRDVPAPLGFCGLKEMRLDDHPVLNLFYRFAPTVWGNGYATEAATSVVGWAAANRARRAVVARVRPGNAASHRVALRAGLVRAPHLDRMGTDGLDWIYVTPWSPER